MRDVVVLNKNKFQNPLMEYGLVWGQFFAELKPEVDRALGCFFEVPVVQDGRVKQKLHYFDKEGQKLLKRYSGLFLPDSDSVVKRIKAEFVPHGGFKSDISFEMANDLISGIRQGLYFDTRDVMTLFANKIYRGDVPEAKIILEVRPGIDGLIDVLHMPMDRVRGEAYQYRVAQIKHLDPAKEMEKETYMITDRRMCSKI